MKVLECYDSAFTEGLIAETNVRKIIIFGSDGEIEKWKH